MLHYQYPPSFCLVGFNGSEHKANCTAVCGAAGTMNLELVGWEHVKDLLVLFHTMCCLFISVLFFVFFANRKRTCKGCKMTRCSITNTLRAFVLLGLTARSTKQTAQQYAVWHHELGLVGWEHVNALGFVPHHVLSFHVCPTFCVFLQIEKEHVRDVR